MAKTRSVIMSTVIEPTNVLSSRSEKPVQRILLEGVPWERYEQLSACFPDSRAPRITYVDGSLEIMSPVGPDHENWKETICYLLEAYLDIKTIRFYGRGAFTLTEPGRAGGEPDASFCIGTDKPVPDLVVEVVDTSDALSKLPLYGALNIPEVWLWRRGALEIHVLDQAQGTYGRSPASRLLPELDVELLAKHVRMPDQYDAVRAFRQAIAG
jgi:Uma2 family endonuclease